MGVLYSKASSQRNRTRSGELVGLGNWATTRKNGDGDPEFPGKPGKWLLAAYGVPHRLKPHMCSNRGACWWCRGGNWDISQGENYKISQGKDWDILQEVEP
jgi:hypothetical protein